MSPITCRYTGYRTQSSETLWRCCLPLSVKSTKDNNINQTCGRYSSRYSFYHAAQCELTLRPVQLCQCFSRVHSISNVLFIVNTGVKINCVPIRVSTIYVNVNTIAKAQCERARCACFYLHIFTVFGIIHFFIITMFIRHNAIFTIQSFVPIGMDSFVLTQCFFTAVNLVA